MSRDTWDIMAEEKCGTLAARIFEKRGGHSEAHLSQEELAGFLTIAFAMGGATALAAASQKLRATIVDPNEAISTPKALA